jgi:hypothetical protein
MLADLNGPLEAIRTMDRVLGVDVAKDCVVLYDPVSGRTFSVPNQPAALRGKRVNSRSFGGKPLASLSMGGG